MSTHHGVSVGIERYGNDFVLAFKAVGKLTHSDYEAMVPVLDAALDGIKDPEIYAFMDVTEFEGWELHAAWDDLKLGVKHARHFEKIAILGNSTLQEVMTKIGGWLISADVKFFTDKSDALTWLKDE